MKEKDNLDGSQPLASNEAPAGSSVTVSEVLSKAWDELMNNISTYAGLALIYLAPVIIFGVAVAIAADDAISFDENTLEFDFSGGLALAFILVIVYTFVAAVVTSAGVIMTALNSFKNSKKLSLSEAWSMGWQNAVKLFVVGLLVGLVIIAGFIALIIPGIIFSIWFAVSVPHNLDTGSGAVDSMKASKRLTKGNAMTIFGVWLTIFVISVVLGLIPILGDIASVVLYPFGTIATVVLYVLLSGGKVESASKPEAEVVS